MFQIEFILAGIITLSITVMALVGILGDFKKQRNRIILGVVSLLFVAAFYVLIGAQQ